MTNTLVYCCLGLWVLQIVAMANAQDGGDGCDENRPRVGGSTGGGPTGGGPNVGPQVSGGQSRVHGTNDDGQQKKGMPSAPQRPNNGRQDYVDDSGDNRNGGQPDGTGTIWRRRILSSIMGDGKNPQNIQQALQMSQIRYTIEEYTFIAYCGYITVNKTTGSNLFFFFLRAEVNDSSAPLVLSLKGGPGMSALYNQFLETGPLGIDAMGRTFYRRHSLHKRVNILYLDAPAGSGFSFVNPEGYHTKLEQTAQEIETFFGQFFLLFPEYKNSLFYISGEGYGGRLGVVLASYLRKTWSNLRGLIIGNTNLGPMIEVIDSSNYLFCVKMTTWSQKEEMRTKYDVVRQYLREGNFSEGYRALFRIVNRHETPQWRTLFQNYTGYELQASVAYDLEQREYLEYKKYANSAEFKRMIHVGDSSVLDGNAGIVSEKLIPRDFHRNFTSHFLDLLRSGLSVVYFVGQLNTWFPADNLENYAVRVVKESQLGSLGDRSPWYIQDMSGRTSLAGYVRSHANFSFIIIPKAGHNAGYDQSEIYREMLRRVVYRVSFVETRYTTVTRVIRRRVVVRQ